MKNQNVEIVENYNPKSVLKYFAEISNIPRGSGNEKAVNTYIYNLLKPFCSKITIFPDNTVYAFKKASKGLENLKTICLQAHSDMVCVKSQSSKHDFTKDSLKLKVEKGWLFAEGTSLGADNGLGVAYILDIFTNNNIVHGPIEALITVGEETTMVGANNLSKNLLKADYLINIDNEEINNYCMGCCGGTELKIINKIKRISNKKFTKKINIQISDGSSGHSGSAIKFKKINAVKLLFSLLNEIDSKFEISLIETNGGSFKNSIPDHANAIIAIKSSDLKLIQKTILNTFNLMKDEYYKYEKNIKLQISNSDSKIIPLDINDSQNIIDAIDCLPNGMFSWNEDFKISDCSSNLGVIKTIKNEISLDFLIRSLYENQKKIKFNSIKSAFYGMNSISKLVDEYPEWTPNIKPSKISELFTKSYKKIFKSEPKVTVIEGGLEIGVILKKYPKISAISCGPEIINAHSISERANIKTIETMYNLLLDLLKNIDKK